MPRDESFFSTPGQNGVFEKFDRFNLSPKQLFRDRLYDVGNPFGDEVFEPVPAYDIGLIVTKDFTAFPVDHGHDSRGVDGHHDDAREIQVGLRFFLFPV